jgi:uncharacterized protein YjbI with pentapeptide repeats
MANQEHFKILKQGVVDWNNWRIRTERFPDLIAADLSGENLRFADLHCVDLTSAKLCRTYLRDADLSNAVLSGADLSDADLSDAEMKGSHLDAAILLGTHFGGTNLSRANLREAHLRYANLHRARLFQADLSYCVMDLTQLSQVDLSDVVGLEKVRHRGPSTIGIDTVYRSEGKIPEIFLRGAGVSDEFIALIKSLAGSIQFYSCFISYSSKDKDIVERLHTDLQSKGVRCWFAPEDLKIGDKLRPSFDDAIRLHDKLMVVLSESSVKSPWVEKEVETAFEKERKQRRTVLFPICVDDAVMETDQAWAADIRRLRHIGDFRDWKNHDSYKKAFDRLLRDLNAEGKAESPAQK